MKKIYIVFLLVIVTLLAIGCSAGKNDVIGIRGEVRNIDTTGGSITLLIKGEVEKDTMYDNASVAIKPETIIVRRQNGTDTEINPEDIELFDIAEVIFEGAVAESYPVQGSAKLIRILS